MPLWNVPDTNAAWTGVMINQQFLIDIQLAQFVLQKRDKKSESDC